MNAAELLNNNPGNNPMTELVQSQCEEYIMCDSTHEYSKHILVKALIGDIAVFYFVLGYHISKQLLFNDGVVVKKSLNFQTPGLLWKP